MKIFKVLKVFTKLGEKAVEGFEFVVDFADGIIHRKERERKARRRRIFWTVLLSILGGIVAVLLFPYRVLVKKNGDFEVRTLLFRVSRKTPEYEIPAGGSEDFEIAAADGVAE